MMDEQTYWADIRDWWRSKRGKRYNINFWQFLLLMFAPGFLLILVSMLLGY